MMIMEFLRISTLKTLLEARSKKSRVNERCFIFFSTLKRFTSAALNNKNGQTAKKIIYENLKITHLMTPIWLTQRLTK